MMVRIAAMLDRLKSICGQREEADGQDRVMHQRRDRRDAELPFEAEPDVDHDPAMVNSTRERCRSAPARPRPRADHLDAAKSKSVAERLAHLVDHRLLAARRRAGAATRISTSAALPKFWTWTSPSPSAVELGAQIARGRRSRACACTSMTVPPLKSMPALTPIREEEREREDDQQRARGACGCAPTS